MGEDRLVIFQQHSFVCVYLDESTESKEGTESTEITVSTERTEGTESTESTQDILMIHFDERFWWDISLRLFDETC